MEMQIPLFDLPIADVLDYDLAQNIRVLIGCEQSGIVRDAFTNLGFDAWSCDLLADEHRSNRHIQGDIREVLEDDWDFMAVMHPPCTRLCNSGVRWLSSPPKGKTLEQMWEELEEGAALFSDCWNADIPRIAVENPVMHKHAKQRIRNFKPAAQTVQPWWFGDPAFKATGLYLKGLSPLLPTKKLIRPEKGSDAHKAWSAIHRASPGINRSKIRSKTFEGIAGAMASQWGAELLKAA